MNLLQSIRQKIDLLTLSPITREVTADRLTYLSPAKLLRLEQAIAQTRGVPGDILEFGVALGGSGIILAQQADDTCRFLGFDVFGMIPPPTSSKDDSKSIARYEVIRSGKSEGIGHDEYYGYKQDLLSEVKSAFARHHVPVDDRKVILCRGLFQDTWAAASVRQVRLAHIDCDWYDPVSFCLRAVAERLSPGGLMVIDDYNDYGGCRTAVDEFLVEHPEFIFERGANPFLRKPRTL